MKTETLDLCTKEQALEAVPIICDYFKIDPLEMLLSWVLYECQKTKGEKKWTKKKNTK